MVIPRDYSPLTRWDRSNNRPRSSSCSSSRDRCRRRGRQHPPGNLRFRRKPFLHPRPPQPANFHLVLILVLRILRPSIGCNGPLLHLQLRHSCQVGWYPLWNSLLHFTLRLHITNIYNETFIYIYIYICMCICICIYLFATGRAVVRLIPSITLLIVRFLFFFSCDRNM